jgi:hypothetical protein
VRLTPDNLWRWDTGAHRMIQTRPRS